MPRRGGSTSAGGRITQSPTFSRHARSTCRGIALLNLGSGCHGHGVTDVAVRLGNRLDLLTRLRRSSVTVAPQIGKGIGPVAHAASLCVLSPTPTPACHRRFPAQRARHSSSQGQRPWDVIHRMTAAQQVGRSNTDLSRVDSAKLGGIRLRKTVGPLGRKTIFAGPS